MPILNYTSQTASNIGVAFVDMPAKAKILFVATTSGVEISSPSVALSNGGSGAANIAIPNLLPGQYYLLAKDQGGHYLAQTVAFYV